MLAARREEAQTPLSALRLLGPTLAPGQMLLVLDEVLTHAPGQGQFQELGPKLENVSPAASTGSRVAIGRFSTPKLKREA